MVLSNIVAGTILILLGMRYVRKGLERLFGGQLAEWLQQMTPQDPYQGFLVGVMAGVMTPSSSAVAALSLQMLNQTALPAGQMLAVVLGANVGITVSVQLLACRLQDCSSLFLVVGGIGFLFLKRPSFRGIGQILLGMGLVFLAMSLIGAADTGANGNRDLQLLFGVIDHYPLIVFLATAPLTVALQSSTASIALGIGLAQAQLLSAGTIAPWVLGANLGTALTLMVAGCGSVEGRRLAFGNLLIKGLGAGLLLFGTSPLLTSLLQLFPGGIDRQAANLNTLFSFVFGMAALPMLAPISRLLEFLIESEPTDESKIINTRDSVPLVGSRLTSSAHPPARDQLRIDQPDAHGSFANGSFSGKPHHFPERPRWKGAPAEERLASTRLS
jgi:phosphate:Na+ symporter